MTYVRVEVHEMSEEYYRSDKLLHTGTDGIVTPERNAAGSRAEMEFLSSQAERKEEDMLHSYWMKSDENPLLGDWIEICDGSALLDGEFGLEQDLLMHQVAGEYAMEPDIFAHSSVASENSQSEFVGENELPDFILSETMRTSEEKYSNKNEDFCQHNIAKLPSESSTTSTTSKTFPGRRRMMGKVEKTRNRRAPARAWSQAEHQRFEESLELFGRNWERCAAYIGTRRAQLVRSHAQKYLIKLWKLGKPLPKKVAESGKGYTLSGKPLHADSASARSYLTKLPCPVGSDQAA